MNKALGWIRRRLRFGLKSILLLTTVVAILVAVVTQPYRQRSRQQRRIAAAEAKGVSFGLQGFGEPKPSLGKTLLKYFDRSFSMAAKLYVVYVPEGSVTDSDLADIASIEDLQRLHLNGKGITDQSLRHFARLPRLRMMTLHETAVTDEGIMHLSGVTSLVSLDVRGTDVSYAALERLDAQLPLAHVCESRAIADLQAAGFQVPATHKIFSRTSPGAVEVILNADLCAENVIIGMNREIHVTAEEMARLSYLQRMSELDIHTVTFDAGAFNSLRPLESLRSMSIANSKIADDDLRALSRQSGLESLILTQCNAITDDGLFHLASLTRLTKLGVSYCDAVGGEFIARLQQHLPDCEIEFDLADSQR